MNYKWSNITFDSLVVENLAPGDAKSAELARPLSVSSANNFWSLYYNRSEDRLLMKNLTYVVGSQVCVYKTCGMMWHGCLQPACCIKKARLLVMLCCVGRCMLTTIECK